MTARPVDVSQLSRPELERLAITLSGRLNAIVRVVRETTKPDWKVAKAVEDELGKAGARLLFVHRIAADAHAERVRQTLNLARWNEFESGQTGRPGRPGPSVPLGVSP
jgi:hypothetical protein